MSDSIDNAITGTNLVSDALHPGSISTRQSAWNKAVAAADPKSSQPGQAPTNAAQANSPDHRNANVAAVAVAPSAAPTPVTAAQLRQIMPDSGTNADRYVAPLNTAMAAHGIDAPAQRAAFLAQISVESQQLSHTSENLDYATPSRAASVYPSSIPSAAAAAPYMHNPEKLANHVYAGVNGNGDENSGDGYRYRGQGLIQITGRENYRAVGYENNPEALQQPDAAADSAAAFYQQHGLNGQTTGVLDQTRFSDISRGVAPHDPNPQARFDAYQRALTALGVSR